MSNPTEITAYLRPDGRKGIRNVVVVAMASITTLGLFYFSRSWWSLAGLLFLLGLTSIRFVRD